MTHERRRQRSAIGRVVSVVGRVVFFLVLVGLILVLWGMSRMYHAYELVRDNIAQVADIDVPQGSQATRVYARDYDAAANKGILLATLYEQNRQQAAYYEFPPRLVACVLSTEDARFFEHQGVDYQANIRALLNIVRRGGEIRGGGSTITQQLSRNVFLPYIKYQKTLNRKIQEIILAFALEKSFTKQEIVEAYMNHVYMGARAYGARAAAQRYFGKDLDQLTLAECALLAGLPQAPSKLNPYDDPEAAGQRRDTVLRLLDSRLDEGYVDSLISADPEMFGDLSLTHEDIRTALAEPINLSPTYEESYRRAEYFVDWVSQHQLYDRFGEGEVRREGLVAITTLDPQIQQFAEETVKEKLDESGEYYKVTQAAVVVLEAGTGEVLACVGGYGWHTPTDRGPDELNRAFISDRQVGSAFKPFTYVTAYEQGFPVGLTIKDAPLMKLDGKDWPQNYGRVYHGWISIFYALQWSRNAASVDLLVNCTGIPPVIEMARKMGVTADLPEVPALTLGVADIKPIEMAEAYATFANMGLHIDSATVKKIYTQSGILIENNDTAGAISNRSNRAFSENTAWIMVQNMLRVVRAGTGGNAQVPGVQIAGKTGTTDDFTDAWFIGYSPEVVCAVWIGNDDYRQCMRSNTTGGSLPAKIFAAVMKKIYTKQVETVGEGEEAVERTIYEPRYTQLKFVKPAGATFNGFPAPVAGSKLVRDEEGNLVPEEESEGPEDQPAESSGDEGGNEGFYESWDPPPEGHVFF